MSCTVDHELDHWRTQFLDNNNLFTMEMTLKGGLKVSISASRIVRQEKDGMQYIQFVDGVVELHIPISAAAPPVVAQQPNAQPPNRKRSNDEAEVCNNCSLVRTTNERATMTQGGGGGGGGGRGGGLADAVTTRKLGGEKERNGATNNKKKSEGQKLMSKMGETTLINVKPKTSSSTNKTTKSLGEEASSGSNAQKKSVINDKMKNGSSSLSSTSEDSSLSSTSEDSSFSSTSEDSSFSSTSEDCSEDDTFSARYKAKKLAHKKGKKKEVQDNSSRDEFLSLNDMTPSSSSVESPPSSPSS
jgi:hypothetical protein